MRALLLAAGLGTRLRPLTDHTPKCLVEIDGRPLLDYWLHALFSNGIERVLINLHAHSTEVQKFIMGSKFASRVSLSFEQNLLGTAGTIGENITFFKGNNFFVAHADNLCVCDFDKFIKAHLDRPKHTEITMMTFDTMYPKSCGIVRVDSENVLIEFHEKVANPPGHRANAAVYIMEPKVANFCNSINRSGLDISNDVVPNYLGRIFTWHNCTYNKDIGDIKSYSEAQKDIQYLKDYINNMNWFI